MKRFTAILAMVIALGASTAFAAAHFVVDLACKDLGVTLQCSGKAAGLGNDPVEAHLDAVGVATLACANRGSKHHQPAGLRDVSVASSTVTITPHNGNITYSLTTVAPDLGNFCPDQMVEIIEDVEFSSATVTIDLGDGKTLTQTVKL